ncbi:MAG: hypothetical protein JNN18_10845 [Rubrivivax sp.]|nr:hypothetical protein [Rubrivivax sp.]
MADKTTFDVTMSLADKVLLDHVDSATIQKQQNAIKGTKTLGVTEPTLMIPVPAVEWSETPDKAKGMVTLAIRKVSVAVSITAKVMIDKAISKGSPCYVHVFEHEKRHLEAYKKGAASRCVEVRRAVADATAPQCKAPVKVAAKDVAAFKVKAEKRIEKALDETVLAAMKEIRAESLAIHTADELKKTNTICAAHLAGPASAGSPAKP